MKQGQKVRVIQTGREGVLSRPFDPSKPDKGSFVYFDDGTYDVFFPQDLEVNNGDEVGQE